MVFLMPFIWIILKVLAVLNAADAEIERLKALEPEPEDEPIPEE